MSELFGDRFSNAIRTKQSVAVIGIDPRVESLPPSLIEKARAGNEELTEALSTFGVETIHAVKDLVPAIKPNIAFFEAHGIYGLAAYKVICECASREGLLVIGDVKRGDIGSTAAAYADGLLAGVTGVSIGGLGDSRIGPHDAITLSPYLGSDSLTPFFEKDASKGFFILVKTSNPSSAELQNLELKDGGTVAEASARLVDRLGEKSIGESGLSSVGAVVGATHPEELGRYRELMPAAPFLVPGYGAQGGSAADIVGAFREDGSGALVNASRSVIFAWKADNNPDNWQESTRNAAKAMNQDLKQALVDAGKWDL